MNLRSGSALAVVLLLVAAACGDSGEPILGTAPSSTAAPATSTTVPATQPTPTSTLAPPDTSVAGGAVASVGEAEAAVVQIVGKGTFVDPFAGVQANVPGSGSGFIVDESGLAVTNNHVVTGAALLEVFLAGDAGPRNARVVAVSECSDLAVIDIDGDGYPFFSWYEGSVDVGLDVFAAGFPLGDPEYTLLDGIVSKADADGETTWASVDAVIEHSADTLPGNSGGPIITTDGEVVAVNYAGNQAGQSFAIGRDVARPIVERLLAGEDVDTIGINGEALVTDSFSGIWVSSVASGSPADVAGVEAGDLILTMEGISLAADGTMAEYCDVLRSHSAADVLTIEVYRPTTDEILEGQINGRELESVFSFAPDVVEAAEPDDAPAAGPPSYSGYVEVADDSGAITMLVPDEWADVNGIAWEFEGSLVGPGMSAAPNLDGFLNTWDTPGVFIAASDSLPLSRAELLDREDFSGGCTFVDRFDYDDGLYVGEYDLWNQCGDGDSTFVVVAAEPPDGSFTILVEIQIVDDRDLEAADEIIGSFVVGGDLGGAAGPPPDGPELLASGLLCRDLADIGFWYGDAAAYWVREGRPDRMDADRNGIPCETVYPAVDIDGYFTVWFAEPSGLLCRDLANNGWGFGDALAYWIAEGTPDRMDADVNGIPCETVYGIAEIDSWLFFELGVPG